MKKIRSMFLIKCSLGFLFILSSFHVLWSSVYANVDYTTASDFSFNTWSCILTVNRKAWVWWHHNFSFTVPNIYQDISGATIYPKDLQGEGSTTPSVVHLQMDIWNYCRSLGYLATSPWAWNKKTSRYFQYKEQADEWKNNGYKEFFSTYRSIEKITGHNGTSSIAFYITIRFANPPAIVEHDYTPPIWTVSYSTNSYTNKDVVVTVACSDDVSWCKQGTYSKTVSSNESWSITIEDNAWRSSVISYNVDWIDKEPPVLNLTCTWLDWDWNAKWLVTCTSSIIKSNGIAPDNLNYAPLSTNIPWDVVLEQKSSNVSVDISPATTRIDTMSVPMKEVIGVQKVSTNTITAPLGQVVKNLQTKMKKIKKSYR